MDEEIVSEKMIRRRSFIAFSGFVGLNLAAFGAWKLLRNSPKEQKLITGGAQAPLRKALNKTELAARKVFSNNHLSQTYPKSRAAKRVRENGKYWAKSSIESGRLDT